MHNELTLKEYMEYSIFYSKEPSPTDKILFQITKIGTMLLNMQAKGSPFKFEDVLIKYWDKDETKKQKPQDIKNFLLGLNKTKKTTKKLSKEEVNKKIMEIKENQPKEEKYEIEKYVEERTTLPRRIRNQRKKNG